MDKTRRYVALSAIVSFTVILLAEQQKNHAFPPMKQLIGYGFVFFALSVGADFGAEPAGAFALLVMVAIILERGGDAIGYIGQQGGQSDTSAAAAAATQAGKSVPVRAVNVNVKR